MMWLQLGVELGIFSDQDAETTFKKQKRKWLASLSYVERVKISKLFRGEAEVFSHQVRAYGIPLREHPNRLSASLFVDGSTEMLFHEVGRGFRDGVLTTCFVFASQKEFHKQLKGKPNPNALLQNKNLRGTNLLLSKYLGFLNHAGALEQLWEYLGWASENNYAVSTLRERVRAMHNWRLELNARDVRERFDEVTEILAKGVTADEHLQVLGLGAAEILERIEALCSSWNGDDTLSADGPVAGGEGNQRSGAAPLEEKPSEKKRPTRIAA